MEATKNIILPIQDINLNTVQMTFKNIENGFKNIFGSKEIKEREAAISKLVSLIKQQRTLYRKEIQEWKTARMAALNPLNPRRKALIELYEDILGDAFIYGISENRKLRVSNKAFAIVDKDGKVDDEKTKLLQKSWFNQYIKYSVESIYFGYNLIYPKQLDTNGHIKKIALVYREHIIPETCEILLNSYDMKGVSFLEGEYAKWVLWKNHDGFLGILDKAAPLWIFKKHSWQNWDEFEEMFGIPMRTAKSASTDPRVQAEIDGWLQDFGSSNWARLPEGVEFEIKESNSRDSFNVFNEKRKACNEELAFLFDGNAEGSKDSGSRAKSETIIDSTQALIALDDETRVLFDVQDELLPFLIKLGYPFSEGDQFIWNENKKATPEERLKIFEGVHRMGYKVKKEQIETELDVEREEIDVEEPPKEDPPKNKKEDPIEDTKGNFKTPHAHTSNCGREAFASYRKIDFSLLNSLSKDEEDFLRKYFNNPDSINWNYKEFSVTNNKLLQGLREGFNGVDSDYESEDHLMMELFQANIHRFGVDKTFKEIMDLNLILKTSKDFSEFRKRALIMFPNYKEKWLATEYEHAKAVSRMGARYIEMMRDIDIAPFWRLVAVLDKRTTKICDSLHNKVFSKLDTKAWQFLPPNHFNCRSDAEDVLASYTGNITTFDEAVGLDPDGYQRMIKQGFNVNWGDAKEVFSAIQSYLHNAGVDPLDMQSLNYKDYNLASVENFKSKEASEMTALLFELFTDRSGDAKFTTVFGSPTWLEKQLFDSTEEKLRSTINDVLSKPSEVYFHDAEGINYKTYFKFYKDKNVKIVTSFSNEKISKVLSIESVESVDDLRKGLLVYTPKEHIADRLAQYEAFSDEFKKIKFNNKNGAFIVQHNLHSASEIKNNLFTSESLFNLGKSVQLLPVSNLKTADALVNDVETEFKLMTKFTNFFNAVKREIAEASKQSSNVLLHINNNYEKSQLIRGLIAAINNDNKRALKFVSILTNDGKLFTFSRKQIETKEFIKILEQ